mgnify:FL=1|jgi:hypothetical protein
MNKNKAKKIKQKFAEEAAKTDVKKYMKENNIEDRPSIKEIYCVVDRKIGVIDVFIANNEDTAIRSFSSACRNQSMGNSLAEYPEDYYLTNLVTIAEQNGYNKVIAYTEFKPIAEAKSFAPVKSKLNPEIVTAVQKVANNR